jgi:large subunit ribosomal protein L25
MAQVNAIKVFARSRSGTGGAREARRQALVPAVVYGNGERPQNITLSTHELVNLMQRGRFLSTIIDLEMDGGKTRVIPREVQVDPINDKLVHVDFQRIGPGARIRVNVPVRFVNEGLSPGLKRGGVLNIVRHAIEVTCPADGIPDHFEFNLEGLEIGRSIHISAIKLPEGVKPTIINRDFTVATVAGHKLEEEPTPGAEAVAAEGVAPAEGEEGAAAAAEAGDAAKAAPGKEAAPAKAPAGKEAAKPAAAARPGADKGKK